MTDMMVGGKYAVTFDEKSTAQLVLAGFQAGGWLLAAGQSLAQQGYAGAVLSNARIVNDPNNASVGLAVVDVDLTSVTAPQVASFGSVAGAVLPVAAFVAAVVAAFAGAWVFAVALVVLSIVALVLPPGSGGAPGVGGDVGAGFKLGMGAMFAFGGAALLLAARGRKGV